MANSIDLLNAMRAEASSTYQYRIPVATQNNIQLVGSLLTTLGYEDTYAEWVGLVGKVALTIFSSRAYSNPLKLLKKGRLPLGQTLEEIFVQMAKADEFDPEGTDALKRVIPKGVTLYHSKEFFHTYAASISRAQVINAFTSVGTLDRFFVETINSLYSGYEQDEFLMMKELLVQELPNAYTLAMKPLTDEATSKTFVRQLRQTILDLGFMSDKYNPLGVLTHTPKEDLVLFIDTKTYARIGVDVLASAFNMQEVNWNIRIIPLDNLNFGKNDTCFALLVDSEALKVYDKQIFMDRQHNGKGSYDTFYLQVNELMGFSHVGNLVAFTTSPLITRTGDVIRVGYGVSGTVEGQSVITPYIDVPQGSFAINGYKGDDNRSPTKPAMLSGNDGTNITLAGVFSYIYNKMPQVGTRAASVTPTFYDPDTGEIATGKSINDLFYKSDGSSANTHVSYFAPNGALVSTTNNYEGGPLTIPIASTESGLGTKQILIGLTLGDPAPAKD